VRVSEFESVATALTLSGQVQWAWIDCFTRFPLSQEDAECLTASGFRLCLVSPELQGRRAQDEIPAMAAQLKALSIAPDAVCTKHPEIWESLICFR